MYKEMTFWPEWEKETREENFKVPARSKKEKEPEIDWDKLKITIVKPESGNYNKDGVVSILSEIICDRIKRRKRK